MKQKVQQRILKFILFNSEWGKREGDEHEKIIYYESFNKQSETNSLSSTSTASLDLFSLNNSSFKSAINDVGLCEALIKFPKSFGSNEGRILKHFFSYFIII